MFCCYRSDQTDVKNDFDLTGNLENNQKNEDSMSLVWSTSEDLGSDPIAVRHSDHSIENYSTRGFKNPFKRSKCGKTSKREKLNRRKRQKRNRNKFRFYLTQNVLPRILEEKGESGHSLTSLVRRRLIAAREKKKLIRARKEDLKSSFHSSKNDSSGCDTIKEVLTKVESGELKTLLKKLSGKPGKKFKRKKMDITHKTSLKRFFTEELMI